MNYVLSSSAVSKLRRLVGANASDKTRKAFSVTPSAPSRFPAPFTVRWAQSVNDGAGNWIIWLPTGKELIVGGTVIDLTADLSAAGDPYPEGWYELSDLDLSQGGDIWLNVTIPETGAPSAEFADEPDDIPILVATIEVDSTTAANEVDSTTAAKRVYQNLVGALVIGGGDGEDDDTHYYADDKSIEKAQVDSGSDTSGVLVESDIFTLKGFGKFKKSTHVQYGTFSASTEMELGSTAMSGVSVLVRVGDVDTPNGNTLGFARLKLPAKDEEVPTPFQYTETEEDQSGETVIVKSIINRAFYWDGRLITSVGDDSGFVIPLTGDVYLKCVGNKNASSQDADANGYVWTFTVGTTPATASGTQKVFNFKLYTFTNGKVTMDWRDTFLALYSGTANRAEPDGVSIGKIPDAAPGATPTGDEGKLEIKGFKSGTPTSQNNLAEYLQAVAQIPSSGIMIVARWVDSNGVHLFYIPLAALNLSDYAKKTDLPTVRNGTLTITQGTTTLGTFTANQATGTKVTIPEPPALSDNPALDVVLSTGNASPGVAADAARSDHVHKLPNTVVDTTRSQTIGGSKTFSNTVNFTTSSGEGSINGRFVRLKSKTNDGASFTLLQPGESDVVFVQLLASGTTGNSYLQTGEQAGHLYVRAQGDGKNVYVQANGSGGIVLLDAAANLSRLNVSPTATAAEVAADASGVGKAIASLAWVCGLQKTFIAGDGVVFTASADGKTITISATNTGGATSGYTGTRNTVAAQRYDTSNHRFQVKYHRETWVNGVMTACTTDTAWTTITGGQAVEETV